MIRRIMKKETKIYLSTNVTDMRKSINGLAAIVQSDFDLDLYSDALFVFCNRKHDKVKILHWDKDGFVLYYKRREKGRFCWPESFKGENADMITQADLDRFLEGLVMESYIVRRNFVVA